MSLTVEFPRAVPVEITFREQLSAEDFFQLCMQNRDLIAEREPDGRIIIMSPITFLTGNLKSRLNAYVTIWAIEHGMGETASASTGFTLPNGAVRSPDTAWVSDERLQACSEEKLNQFPPLVPDFVAEIRSKSDKLKPLQRKMAEEWIGQGVRLGWLIDLKTEKVYIYRADGSITVVESFAETLSGEDVMPGFNFELSRLAMRK